jgi:hypothetical protein
MRLGFTQRVVAVVGLGAALLAIGSYITSLGGPVGWVGYAPMRVPFAGFGGLSAGPRLAVWLVLTALWVAVSLFILREPAEAPGDAPAPAPAAASGPAPGASAAERPQKAPPAQP